MLTAIAGDVGYWDAPAVCNRGVAEKADIIGPAGLVRKVRRAMTQYLRQRTRGDGRDVENVDRTIASLLKTGRAPYGEQVEIARQDCPIKSGKAARLALLLHEFATNAVKYGSLSTAHGLLRVQVRRRSL